jgi:peroxiredoxin
MRNFSGFVRALTLAAVVAVSSIAGADAPMAPGFNLPTQTGGTVSLDKLRGQVVMINFWASWCGPCRQEMPLLEAMYQKYSRLGFTLVGVNVDENSADAERFLAKVPVSFPVAFDRKSEVSKMYDVQAMPSSIFIDRKGNVRHLHAGYKPGDEAKYQAELRALLKE